MVKYFIGTSGWWYNHWKGIFYPQKLEEREWFKFYASHFDTVEVNSSFYRLPFPNLVRGWAKKAPPGFKFTLKGWRRITHLKRLKEIEEDLFTFLSRLEPLKGKMGAILFQLPPSFRKDLPRLENFLKTLPSGEDWVIEFRHSSWFTREVFNLLKRYRVGYCVVSMPRMPEIIKITSPVGYVRFHGKEILYGSPYSDEELLEWREKIREMEKEGAERIYLYFNNDYNAYAVFNALKLKEILEG